MYSHLFRQETARRLRAVSERVIDLYLDNRYPWLNAYSVPSRDQLRFTLETLAEAVAAGDFEGYGSFTEAYIEALIERGIPPVAVLAAADLFYSTVLRFLTPDQRELVEEILEHDRARRQSMLYERVIRPLERGA
jgi:hypothetical protein